MRAVVVGGDGRAHALAHVLARSCEDVIVSGGNPAMPGATPAPATELDGDLFVISPEAPLVEGLADRLRAQGKRVFGPGADGARLEGSKAWMKEVVTAAGVPTARHASFSDAEPALRYLRSLAPPYVVKTDGLAAGKGVLVTESLIEAEDDVRAKLSGASFGDAGRTVVIEEGLSGPELSVFAICDGTTCVPLAPAQDFKRALDGDKGPNTGGMGSYSPVALATPALVGDVLDRFVEPTLHALRRRGVDYRGALYAGLMLTAEGPKLIEYNVRIGDPEAQVVLPRMASDLFELLAAAADGDVRRVPSPATTGEAAVCVIAASPGYPEAPRTGALVEGVGAELDGAVAFFAGVAADEQGRLVTAGGRVFGITGLGATITEARQRAYAGLRTVRFAGMHVRNDIAAAAAREEQG